MRRAFVDSLTTLAERDPRVILLTGDLGFQVFDDFIARCGRQYVNVGVAEAQMVCAAAGLALEGFRPIVYSIASFMTGRPFEQLRVSVAYPGLSVVVVGAGGGFCYSACGVTHHAAEDFALMSLLPGMTVVGPGDPNEVKALLPQMLALDGPSYIRIGKFGEPTFEADSPIILGRGRKIRDGARVAVITTGEMAPVALAGLAELAAEGIAPLVYQFHTIKPLDTATLDDLAARVKTLVVVEEAAPIGGLASAVTAWRTARDAGPRIVRLGPPDAFALGNLGRDTLRAKLGFDAAAIRQACRDAWRA
jgi:transketolase